MSWSYLSVVSYYLLVIGDRAALGWVLCNQRMAFPDFKRPEVRALTQSDTLFLYTTRACFGNPTRDRGRIIASGRTASTVTELDKPVTVAGRTFPVGCDVEFQTATAWGDGVELAALLSDLYLFDGVGEYWSIRLRRPLVGLTEPDAEVIRHRLAEHRLHPLGDVLDTYARWWKPSEPGQG